MRYSGATHASQDAKPGIGYAKPGIGTSRNQLPQGQLLVGGRPVGTADDKGRVHLDPGLTAQWFSLVDDPFQDRFVYRRKQDAFDNETKWEVEATLLKADGETQNVRLKLELGFCVASIGLRVRLPSPGVEHPMCGSMIDIKPDCVIFSVDNSEEQFELRFLEESSQSNPPADLGPWRFTANLAQRCAVGRREFGAVVVLVSVAVQRAIGQQLVILHDERLVDATVIAAPSDSDSDSSRPTYHRVLLSSGDEVGLELNEFNHCIQRLENVNEYEQARLSFCEHLCSSSTFVQDAITGISLRVEDQTLQINPDFSRGVQQERWVSARAVTDLAPLLLEPSSGRQLGAHEVVPALIEAPPGTGKVRVPVLPCPHSIASLMLS